MSKFNGEDHKHEADKAFSARLSIREASKFKGLPERNALFDLAKTYLESMAKLWPELVLNGTLPRPTQSVLEQMVEQFERHYLGKEGLPDVDRISCGKASLGIVYARYSSINANPRSLDQQLKLILECAAKNGVFVPWELVYADAGVTGRTAKRRGYQMAKAAVKNLGPRVSSLLIDEMGRASRDAIESLQLGKLMEQYSKRLLGASDGFDSSLPNSKQQLHFSAMVHENYVDNLKAKVNRGRKDAFERGQHVGMFPIGYRLVTILDGNGEPVLSHSGKIRRKPIIDEATAGQIRDAFELYVHKGWSPGKISDLFNQREIGGRTNWQSRKIRDMIRRTIYKGLMTDGMMCDYIHPETCAVRSAVAPF